MKRFYSDVKSFQSDMDRYEIHIDGRPVKTPARALLTAPNAAIAALIVDEWEAQIDIINPHSMPVTQIISTQIDKVSRDRPAMTHQLLRYVNTDLLFYRTDHPAAMAQAQAQIWDPILRQFEAEFSLRESLKTTTDLQVIEQPDALHTALSNVINSMDDLRFTVLQLVTSLAGSIITGTLFTGGKLTPDDVMTIARVEENFKDTVYDSQKYGRDPMQEKTDTAMFHDLTASVQILKILPC